MTGRPDGAPDSDPLDRIEARVTELGSAASLNVADVLALVAVARAARLYREQITAPHGASNDAVMIAGLELDEALARLDGAL